MANSRLLFIVSIVVVDSEVIFVSRDTLIASLLATLSIGFVFRTTLGYADLFYTEYNMLLLKLDEETLFVVQNIGETSRFAKISFGPN